MDLFLKGLILLFLIVIVYQDLKYRAVSWVIFPILFVAILVQNGWEVEFTHYLVNISFVLVQLFFITIYLTVKEKYLVKIWETHLGLGDILFWGILTIVFSPLNFILFYLLSLIFTVILIGIVRLFKTKIELIPLAGFQALLLVIAMMVNSYTNNADFLNDELIISYLYGRA